MAKPILIVRLPHDRNYRREGLKIISEGLEATCPDYNIITFVDVVGGIQFEVFNVQDYPQIEFDQLKEKIESYGKTV